MTRRTRPDRPTLAEDVAAAVAAEKWSDGDVALMTFDNASPAERADGVSRMVTRIGVRGDNGWGFGFTSSLSDRQALGATIRRLVVIDPEGRDVNRLIIRLGTRVRASCSEIREVLRDLHTDPKPDEPTGLGAVVEDAQGERWVRTNYANVQWLSSANGIAAWADVEAVRVLSDGVEP